MKAITVGMIVAGSAVQIGGVVFALMSDPTNFLILVLSLVFGGALESAGVLLWVTNRG